MEPTVTPDLEMFGVYDRGVATNERVVLRAHTTVDLTYYALMVGITPNNGQTVYPAQDFFLWLGNTTIEGPAWVFVYTGKGQSSVSREKHTGEPIHSIYWNRPNVLLAEANVFPALIKFGDVQIYSGTNQTIQSAKPPAFDYQKLLEELQKEFLKTLSAPKK